VSFLSFLGLFCLSHRLASIHKLDKNDKKARLILIEILSLNFISRIRLVPNQSFTRTLRTLASTNPETDKTQARPLGASSGGAANGPLCALCIPRLVQEMKPKNCQFRWVGDETRIMFGGGELNASRYSSFFDGRIVIFGRYT
jgi:hypothetical protein